MEKVPALLVVDRDCAVYLEQSDISAKDGRVVCSSTSDDAKKEINIPYANIAVLFCGHGTTVSQEAMHLLSEEQVLISFSGDGGAPLHMAALDKLAATPHFRALMAIHLDEAASLAATKSIAADRIARIGTISRRLNRKYFRSRDDSKLSHACRNFGALVEKADNTQGLVDSDRNFGETLFAIYADMTEIKELDNGKVDPRAKSVRNMIDHGDRLCLGMASAALWALGIPPYMPLSRDKAGGLVSDVAGSFKDSLVLPLAFAHGSKKVENSMEKFRSELLSAFNDSQILKEAIETVVRSIEAGRRTVS